MKKNLADQVVALVSSFAYAASEYVSNYYNQDSKEKMESQFKEYHQDLEVLRQKIKALEASRSGQEGDENKI
jgi:hypothetical protein